MAQAEGDDALALAELLSGPLESATCLVLLEVLSVAAADITREIAAGAAAGLDPEFSITMPAPDDAYAGTAPAQPESIGDAALLPTATRRRA